VNKNVINFVLLLILMVPLSTCKCNNLWDRLNATRDHTIPGITYSDSQNIFTQGTLLTLTPIVTGVTPTTFTVSPPLPAGLVLNTSTGVISGTPSSALGATSYTLTATNMNGTGTATFSIAVKSAGTPLHILYVSNASDNTVTFLNAATGALLGTYVTGTFPEGMAVNTTANILYVANTNDNSVTFLDATTGLSLGTFATGLAPQTVVLNTSNNIIYIPNNADNTVSFMNALTGSVIGTFSTGAGSAPLDAAVNYATNALYVLNGNGSVVFFDATTGTYANGSLGSSTTTGISTSTNLYYSSSANAIFYINWTSSPSSTDVRGVNVSTGLSAGTFSTGWSGPNPFRMAGNQSANIFYISEFYGNQLKFMNASTGAIINSFLKN